MIIIGLTGSIGMGKSTTASFFRRENVPVFDADACVHRLMAHGGRAVSAIHRLFPGSVTDGAVNRQALGEHVFGRPERLHQLEGVLHPLVRSSQRQWLAFQARRRGGPVVLDVPLLFETGAEKNVDVVLVVSAPARIQRKRVLARPGMSADKFTAILKQQLPDREKRRRATFVVDTGLGRAFAYRQVRLLLNFVRSMPGTKWGPGWGR